MMTCSLFGHRDVLTDIRPRLEEVLRTLFLTENVTEFLVGNQGGFDRMAYSVLCELRKEYPRISGGIALAYLPGQTMEGEDYTDTFFPEGLESVPRRFAISYRNRWLIEQSDFVVVYVDHSWGGAAQAYEKALKKGLPVINLGKYDMADR